MNSYIKIGFISHLGWLAAGNYAEFRFKLPSVKLVKANTVSQQPATFMNAVNPICQPV